MANLNATLDNFTTLSLTRQRGCFNGSKHAGRRPDPGREGIDRRSGPSQCPSRCRMVGQGHSRDYVYGRSDWQFFLASSLVEQQGPGVAYQKAFDALRTSPRGDAILARITVSMIKIVGETDPIAADVFKIVRAYRGKPPIYVSRCRLGQIQVEELHIFYVTALPAPWQSLVLKTAVEAEEPLSPQESQAMNQIVA